MKILGLMNKELCLIIFLLTLIFSFNGTAIYVGLISSNATCHQENSINLSIYLVVSNMLNITHLIFLLCVLYVPTRLKEEESSTMKFHKRFLSLYTFVVAIVGIIALSHSYSFCIDEVKTLCVFTIITIMYYLLNSCYYFVRSI